MVAAALSLKPFEQEEKLHEKDKRAIKPLCAKEVTSLVCTHKLSEGEQSYQDTIQQWTMCSLLWEP